MANEQNLKPLSQRTKSEQRQIATQGGIASGEARRRKRDIRRALEILLEKDYQGKDGEILSGAEAIAFKQLEKALKGDTKAFEVVRDTVGQKPAEKIEMTVDDSSRAEMEAYFGRQGASESTPEK